MAVFDNFGTTNFNIYQKCTQDGKYSWSQSFALLPRSKPYWFNKLIPTKSPVATTSIRYWLTLSFSYNDLSSKLQNSKFYKNTKWSFSLLDCPIHFCSWLSSWCKVVFHLDYLWCIMAHAQDSKIHNSCDDRWVTLSLCKYSSANL